MLSARDDQHSRKLVFFSKQFLQNGSGGGRGGGGAGKGCYIFSILVYIVEYFTVVKVNTIRLKPKTSGSLRKTLKVCKKHDLCNSTK